MSPSHSSPRTVAHEVGRMLAAQGVEHVFGVTGSGNFIVTSALVQAGATYVAARHEAGAVTMADGYARAGRRTGMASVHQGPGLTNALTGLTEAVKSRSPLVLLAGDTSDGAIRSNFYIPQADVTAALGAGTERPRDAAEAPAAAARALARATAEHRPVVLHLALDVQHTPALAPDPAHMSASAPAPAPTSASASKPAPASSAAASASAPASARAATVADADLQRLVAAVDAAERPLILAGRGVWDSGCAADVAALRERTGGLLATSAAANGQFAGDPWSLGICGGFASPPAAELIRDADLILGLGVSYTKWTTRHGRGFAGDATVVQVDHDRDALAADPRVDLTVRADVAEVAAALLKRCAERRPAERRWDQRIGRAAVAACAWHAQPYADETGGGLIDPRTLSLRVEAQLPAARTVVVDGGHFVGWPSMYWPVPDPAGYLFTGAGFQSIGLGLGTAAGAAIARPDRVTVLAIGDGGLHMSLAELDTLARLNLPVLVVVYNDAAYGAEVHHYRDSGGDLGLVRFPDSDFVSVAAGFGIRGATVREPSDLDVIDEWRAGDDRGPLLLDAKIVPTVVADYQSEAFVGH